jgi:AcrR family transcriptional regulator
MNESALTPGRILAAAEDVLRRFGSTKATVVDVARVLGVSHGSVYRHFPSKAPLAGVATENSPAPERLRRWLDLLITTKRRRALEDPELFANYLELAADARDVVRAHVDALVRQIARIVADGVARGEFTATDPVAAGRAVFDATARFHNPVHAAEWTDPGIDAAFEGVWSLILGGLGVRKGSAYAGTR